MTVVSQSFAAQDDTARAADFTPNLHYLRGLAALGVFVFHAGVHYQLAYGDETYARLFPNTYGFLGVSLFFVMSGYLMSGLVQKRDPVDFLFRRIVRIFPLLIILTLVTIHFRPLQSADYNFLSLFMAPVGKTNYPLRVEWTLVNEMFFYLVLFGAAAFGAARFILIIAVVWLAAVGVNLFAEWSTGVIIGEATLRQLPLMPENIGLLAGSFVPLLVSLRLPVPLFATIFIACMIGMQFELGHNTYWLVAVAGCTSLVAAAIQSHDVLPSWGEPIFRKLGDWSYAIYLIHVPIMTIILRPASMENDSSTFVIWVIVVLAAAAMVGEVDRTIHRASKNIRSGSAWVTFLVAGYLAAYAIISFSYT